MINKLGNGTRVFNLGDMANHETFGTVVGYRESEWGDEILVVWDDNNMKVDRVSCCSFSKEFKGNGLTRIVTEEAYNAFYSN